MIAHIDCDADWTGDGYRDLSRIYLQDATDDDVAALEARGYEIEETGLPDESCKLAITSGPCRAFHHWIDDAVPALRALGAEVHE